MTLSCTYDGGAVTHKFAPSGLNVTHRADGEASFGGIPFEDPTASLAIVGHRLFTVEDGECAQPRIFTGFTTERGIGRSLDEGMFVGAAPRLVDVTLVDMNAALGFRQITGADGNRPAETWAARLTWILGSDYLSEFISSDETWIVTNTTAIEAADYRGAYATAVLDDLVDRSGGAYVYFAFYDTVAAEVRLFFDNDSESIGDCTLAISNVVADIDSSVTFAPDLVAKLAREPDQTYSDVTVTYDRGAKKLYRYRASTAATYVRRGTEISRPYTKGLATATAQAEKWLDKHAVETDRITCTIRVPAASAGLVQAGQSIQARFSHLGATYSVAGGATMRIVSCSPKPTDDTGYWYDIALELVGARPVVEEGCDCLEGEDGTITTGVTDVSVRQVTVGPIHVPANCSMTITRYDWTEWTPGIALPVRIGGTFKDVLDNSLDEHMFTDFGSNPYGVKVTLGADLGSPHGAGFSTDDLGIPDVGWALSGMLIENGSANDFDIWWHGDSNPYFESTGTWSVTATYTCGDGAPADEIIDLGPTPGATTTHTTDPTVDDDETLGYGTPGMHWVNTTTGHEFVLIDGTDGAAVWVSTTAVSVFSFSTSDGVTTVDPTTELTFVGGTLADLGGGVAELTLTGGTPAADTIDANAAPYSCVGDDATDATAGIQAAIDAASTLAATNGVGIVEFDEGTYLIGGALVTTGNFYAQITLPEIANTAAKQIIILRPKRSSGITYVNGAQTVVQPGPVVFRSSLTGQSYSGTHGTPSIFGGPDPEKTATFSNIQMIFENVGIRAPANPTVCGLNLQGVQQAILENVRFDTTDVVGSITEPTAVTGCSVLMPLNSNNGMADYRGICHVMGWYAGPGVNEHTQADKLLVYRCAVGLNIQSDYYHGAQINHLNTEHCPYGIATVAPASGIVNPSGASGYAVFNIDFWDIEDAASGWAMPTYHVNDPGDDYYGRVRYVRVLAGVGTQTGALTVNSAANLSLDDLTGLPASGGAPTTADYLVGTAQGGLSAEIVVGATPGGELGGTWASPTVDATHSGSAHLALGATSSTAAAGDHTHAATSGGGELLITDTPAGSPLVFDDILQNDAGDALLYADA